MPQISPFIHFNGNAEDAFTFYQSVFGGTFTNLVRFKDLPGGSNEFIAENESHKIMQISLPIGKSHVLKGSDVPDFMGKVNEEENRSKILISTESVEEADKIFHGLSVGGKIEVSFAEDQHGSYFGMLRDKYGIEWMVEFNVNQTSL